MMSDSANVKVVQLAGEPHSAERHDYAEGLLVAEGQVKLIVDGEEIAVNRGGMFVVPAGALHSVDPASSGTLVIFD